MWRSAPAAVLLGSLAASSLLLSRASASSSGPPPARTGGFGETTCRECHWENPANDPSGSLVLTGIPETYTPGEAYMITVSVAHPEMRQGGFELSARVDGPGTAGSGAGTLRPADGLTAVTLEKGITYIAQTEEGARTVSDRTGRWTIEWTAPASTTPVVFHVAANAANGDASPLGDFVYTTTAHTRP